MRDRKEYDRERKKLERANNTEYAQRQRAFKRTPEAKAKRKEARQDPELKAKEAAYARLYRKRPEVRAKNKAREKAKAALIKGIIKRPANCELCSALDVPLGDGRSGLRMDHYKGYDQANWINVQFICVKCDGEQLRKDYE